MCQRDNNPTIEQTIKIRNHSYTQGKYFPENQVKKLQPYTREIPSLKSRQGITASYEGNTFLEIKTRNYSFTRGKCIHYIRKKNAFLNQVIQAILKGNASLIKEFWSYMNELPSDQGIPGIHEGSDIFDLIFEQLLIIKNNRT